ncbi:MULTISPECIES: class I SAM-dependent methyltransferase [unclassified Arthrobacter]|uniref:class I SAM-dependent methyltransferase n=1 Tax=unclassified Arthrobacter TaxID=235627 RepID=UPI001492BEAF|nr:MULTISPECIES: class I SAM-dependent methyltransferase [unclassified Arthrobacter]MBE0010637.1 class I SAM-dependent methyltransferase [Arthrobacter sp. AET 35A]NOJ64498.1 class I SAM-dependent methyltransferase [Arthrobacter sp. 147(2020)]
MGFAVGADSYDRFMGQYSVPLAREFVSLAGVHHGERVLDVGCGPGALTVQLASLLGPEQVAGVDPSAPFVDAARVRLPGVDIRRGTAEDLPFRDGSFDVALAQLVVHFMADPVAGLREMSRVTRSGGIVAACVCDHAGAKGPLATFWEAVQSIDDLAPTEADLAGTAEGQLAALFDAAGLREIEQGSMTVRVEFESFAAWWEPYTLGVGPAGDYVRRLDMPGREELRHACAGLLPAAPFGIDATAWTVRARPG